MAGGLGSDIFEFDFLRAASRVDIIKDFTPGADHLHLGGYAASEVAGALSRQTSDGHGGTMLALTDGTKVDLVGIVNLTQSAFV